MLTKDGKPFVMGMTLVTNGGREIKTDEATHEIEEVEFEGTKISCIQCKDGRMGTDLRSFFSSQEARIAAQVERLERIKNEIDLEIKFLKEGGDPAQVSYLKL